MYKCRCAHSAPYTHKTAATLHTDHLQQPAILMHVDMFNIPYGHV